MNLNLPRRIRRSIAEEMIERDVPEDAEEPMPSVGDDMGDMLDADDEGGLSLPG